MRGLKAMFICVILPFVVLGCGSTKQAKKAPEFKFAGTTLAKGINDKGATGLPVEPTTVFYTENPEVVAHVKFEALSGKHRVRWDWYDPKGNLYYSTGNFPIETSKGKYVKEATAWHRLAVQGDKAEDYPGEWELKLYLDDELVESKHFWLNVGADVAMVPVTATGYYPQNPKDWAFIVGIEDYAHLPHVDYARRDALIVKEYFNKILGVPENNIVCLLDSDATKARIQGYLKEYIPQNVGKDANLYVYFAGHGAPDSKKGDSYLVPHDGDVKFITETGYNLKAFYQDLEHVGVQRVYVFLDSCFSGFAARAAEMLAKGTRPALIYVEDVRLDSDDIVAITSSSAGQTSNAYPETEHGLFTYYLLGGLRGEADADDNKEITVQEIYQYVREKVSAIARRMGTEQTPSITPSLERVRDVTVGRIIR